ncbi:DUF1810 domain-containing protein [Dongia sp.]|uniref:DUF1810 domain-containing protein n=1 Tax=Dongia sp. TaxID=1977262 RepID=UPI0035B36254
MPDSASLHRFIAVQDPVYARVLAELRQGRKSSHWMWYVFPQIAGLGFSQMSRLYAIADLAEARAYLADPILGARLRECTTLVNAITGRSVHEIFGSPDDVKFQASMTLFQAAATDPADRALFHTALQRFFGGESHPGTLARL